MLKIFIDNRKIGESEPVYFIAEISANHNGSLEKAKELISAAKDSGADAVKLQTYTADTMTIDSDLEPFKINEGPWKGQTLYQLYQKAFTPWEWHEELKRHAVKVGITLFSTPFDFKSADFLEKLGVQAYKIASFELVDIPLIRYVARKGKPVIVSTGMGTLEEIEESVAAIRSENNNEIILLYCVSSYPARAEDMHLNNIRFLAEKFDVIVGLSDHSLSTDVAIASISLGAKVIEKHLIMSRSEGGPDAFFSMEPTEFKSMVSSARSLEKAFGEPFFGVTESEQKNFQFRRSLFVIQDMKKGELFTEKNIRSIRPGHGLQPKHCNDVIGKKASREIARGTPLSWDLVNQKDK